jgi:hypothetical protein
MNPGASTLRAPNADGWKPLAGRIRQNAVGCGVGLLWCGSELGGAMWRPRDPFFPYTLIVWGFVTVLLVWRTIVSLNQLSYTVPLAVADEKKKEARSLIPYILGTALMSFCVALSIVAAKEFGRLCAIGAAVLGGLLLLMIWVTERRIKRVARSFYSSRPEPLI